MKSMKPKNSAMGMTNTDPEMGRMILAMHKKAQKGPKLMVKGKRNRKMAGKGISE